MSTSISQDKGDTQTAVLQLSTNGAPVKDYAANLHFSLCEVMRLAFEHRELDVEEDQTYGFNVLITLVQQLGTIISETD